MSDVASDVATRMKNSSYRDLLPWFVPFVSYLAFVVPIAIRNRYQINPDGIIYLRKAQLLLKGDFLGSVSGYWSPGMSWCIAAALKVSPHSNPLNVIHAILAFWGFCWTIACCVLLYAIAPRMQGTMRWGRTIAGVAIALVGIRLAVVWMAPDLQLCAFLVAYLCCCSWRKQRWWTPMLGGVFAGLAYLSKSYALPFFILHFPATLIYQHFSQPQRSAWRRSLMLGFCGLAMIVVPWMGVLTYKYGKPTMSMVYHHNHLNVATGEYLRSTPDFCLVPPDPYLCIWEGLDPGPRIDWSPFSDIKSFGHQIGGAVRHTWWIIEEVYRFDRIALILCVTVVALLPHRWMRGKVRSSQSLWLIMTGVIYCGGFLVVAFESRYVIPILLPLGLALCFVEAKRFDLPWGGVSAAGVVLLVAIVQLWPFAFFNPPRQMFKRVALAMERHHLTQLFSSSNNNNGADVSWYLNRKIVLLPAQEDIGTVESKLRALGVENMLVWTDLRTNVRDPFPVKLISLMKRTHHWELALNIKLDSARSVSIYHWIGDRRS